MPVGFKTKMVAPRHPKVVKREEKAAKLIPSVYAQEMSQTTEERLANNNEMHPPRILELLDMSETTHHKFSSLDLDQAMFQPYPSEIVFQNYTPFKTYKVPLELRNSDKVPRLVKVTEDDSLYFKVVSPIDASKKVAPGMASTFTILFTPQENKDYLHRLICVTEREKFEVPICAIGPRAILDFPDSVHFQVCPVKCVSQRTLLVRNIGNCEAKFQLRTCNPFSVQPSIGTLDVGQSMQVTVEFLPKTTGDHSQDLLLHYHSGEDIHICLSGDSTDINVGLDKNFVMVEKTYISLANYQNVTIMNRSDSIVHYQWKNFASDDEEEQDKLRLLSEMHQEENEGMEQILTECTDPSLRACLSRFSYTLQEQLVHTQQQLLSLDQHIIVRPQEGEIWPNRTAEVNIIFRPQEARLYQQTVYCEITGRESRLQLCIQGEGIGPKLQFRFDSLDMGDIVIGSKQSYKLFLINKGLIKGAYKLVQPSTTLGHCFSINPSEGIIPPEGCQTLDVQFSSDKIGIVSEELHFSVVGKPEPVIFTFSGRLIGPTFHLSVPELNFGEVSFGFPQTLTCCLTNTSMVAMSFGLRIPGDGAGVDSITSMDQVSQLNRSQWGLGDKTERRPTEFILSPSTGTVRALAEIDIQLTLCSNTVQDYSLALVVDIQGVGEEVLALPIKARCVVPDVILENPVLQFQHCFLGHPYEQSVKLVNDTDLPACYGLLPQPYEEEPPLLYTSTHPRGVIQAHSTEQIPLVLLAKTVGSLQQTAHVAILGRQDPPLELLLSCVGQGPSVSVTPAKLNFGCIPVLTDVPRTLQLSNNSPIPARFLAQMVKKRSHWHVQPSEGEVSPEEMVELKLIAHLNDTVPFLDELLLEIQDSQSFKIPVSATGQGTTIVTDRPFAPSLDLGTHFSSGPCQYPFRITNQGRRTHQLFWSTEGFAQLYNKDPMTPDKFRNRKSKSPQTCSVQEGPVFTLTPARLSLPPGHTADMLLEGSSDIPKMVREKLVCHAIVGRHYGRECIMTVDITCQFVTPGVDISSQQINFYVEKAPDVFLVPLYQRLVLKSVSSLNLSIELTLHDPFGLCDYEGDEFTTSKSLVLGVGAQKDLWVRFNPMYRQNCFTYVVEDVLELCYHGHPQQDRVALRGEVHFPNLQFSSTTLDFGCILNNTKSRRKLTMTNCSPLYVSYRWAFLVDRQQCHIRFFDEKSRGIEGYAGGRREESRETQWELLERREAVGKTDPNSETDIAQLGEEELDEIYLGGSASNGQEQNRTSSTQRPASTELGTRPFSLTAMGHPSVGVKEVFDISSLYGILQPGDTKLLTFSFLGHADISAHVLAMCEVEGGPTYEITLKGQASSVSYTLDKNDIDFGLLLFDHVAEAEITLKNTGRVGFDFSTLSGEQGLSVEQPLPGQPLIIPSKGHLEQHAEMKLSVYYLPGIPESFQTTFQLQVAFYETEIITVRGEGIFPRLCLDLPRDLDEEMYGSLLMEAKNLVESDKSREGMLSRQATGKEEMPEDDYIPTYDALLQMELEQLLVKENAIAIHKQHRYTDQRGSTAGSSNNWLKKLCKLSLPEYKLDFGYVINGSVATHIVKVTNTCPVAVSFRADRNSLAGTGFSTELDRVQNLPFCETETFEVKFDASGANLELGKIDAVLPIQVVKGPWVQVRLCAEVTMPSLTVSTDTLQFDTIQCGLCQVSTIQLYNHGPVPCEWSIRLVERPKKIEKHIPLYLRRQARLKQRPLSVVFEILPYNGTLYPGDRTNVQVKFSPAEGRAYSQRLMITVAQSTQKIMLLVQGQGEEPQLEFSSSELDFGPILPYSKGKMAEVMVRNPCSFPVEFYSLDFDKQYLEEEEILRMLKGYDAQNVLILPPRAPGKTLPVELLDYYKEHSSQEPKQESGEGFPEENKGETAVPSEGRTLNGLTKDHVTAVGDLEYDPVSRAIVRYMGIDPSLEGKAAQNCQGIALIVHGAPLSGKTRTAVTLAKHYGAACLNVDEVVLEAVTSGSRSAGLRARELCIKAAVEYAQRAVEEAAAEKMETAGQGPSVLSVEAVAKHTAEDSQTGEPKVHPSSASTRNKTSTTVISKKNGSSGPAAASVTGQIHRHLSMSASQYEELDPISCFLPDDLLVDILSERLQLSDCHHGVVIDGLETMYCSSLSDMLQIILKALNSRRHIYVINLFNSYNVLKHREQDRFDQEQEERRQQELENLREDEMTPKEDRDTPVQIDPLPVAEDLQQEQSSERDRHLLARFHVYEQSQPQLQHILEFWDRTQGLLSQPIFFETQETEETTEYLATTAKKSKKEREKEKVEKLKVEASDVKSPAPSQAHVPVNGTDGSENIVVPDPIPHIWLSIKEGEYLSGYEITRSMKLPSLDEILDELGLGPKGPPIPPPIIFSIVPYPEKRSVPSTQLSDSCFIFMTPSSPEELSEEKKEVDLGSEAKGPITSVKEDMALANTSNTDIQWIHSEDPHPECNQRLTHFRWIVPPSETVTLRIMFCSSVLGKYDQAFSFELMGTKRCYQLYCKGICAYPTISRDPKIMFAHCKMTMQPESGLQKTYIIQSKLYEFGPLLCGKTRERYKKGKYPENMERFVIHNNSLMEAEIHFCFQHDTNATTFFLDPPNITLEPNEQKVLMVWAYPNTPRHIEDSVVCCIKENPEPVVFHISCVGVRPELELDHKLLHFDKIPPYRKETRSLCLSNNTLLPAAWKIRGMEMLGDEFTVSQDQGIIMPHSKFCLHMHFIARNPIKLKKAISLEVSDVENILGIIQHSENIQIIAEAYDIAVDINSDGSLDFGTFKVSEEVKRSIKLENKGKYDIAFKFALEATEPGMPDLNSIFSITPHRGTLHPNNKTTSIQIIFFHNKEMSIKDNPILCCQIIEPNVEGGETINTIPIKVSVQALFSKYSITPSNDINFGPLVYGSRKRQTLTVENKGNFEIRFSIRMCKNQPGPAQRRGLVSKKASKDNSVMQPSSASKIRHTVPNEFGMPTQTHLTLGVFSLSPCFGVLAPGAQQVVTVDCKAEHVGSWVECLAIDISDRDPSDNPDGILFKLLAEVCMPGIANTDIASIFEEHRICKNGSMLQCEQYRTSMGVYVQDESKFVFNSVLVGQSAKAQIRLTNPEKVPCELSLLIKSVKPTTSNAEVFELTPTRMCIPSHSHAFATVTFSPLAMQTYHAVFEAILKGSIRPKALVFDLMGEGNLPCITVLKPVQRTNQGQPVLQFKRLVVGRAQTLPFVIKNNGCVSAQVSIILQYHLEVFTLKAAPGTTCRLASSHIESDPGKETQVAYVASLTLLAGQEAQFQVGFHPKVAQRFEASMKLMVQDNQYDQTVVQLVGEGYHDIIILDNIGSKVQQDSVENMSDLLHFGDCHVRRTYQETLTMTNPSNSKVLRFEWLPSVPHLSFSPQVGHLHAGCSKVVTVAFCSEQPVVLNAETIKCKLSSITFQHPVDLVPDWDDSHRTVKWMDADNKSSQQPTKQKVVVTDPEPPHSVFENSSREVELIVSATCDFVQYQCDTGPICFKDTMLYQTRVYQLHMENKGSVKLEYSWQVLMDKLGKTTCFEHGGRTSRSAEGSRTPLRPASSLLNVFSLLLGDPELPPFSVEPGVGFISPGESQSFHIRFSPLDVAKFEARLICSIPNLQGEQSPVISVSGRSLLPYCHFHLKDSDYLTGNRRNPELYSPIFMDPNTRVIEFTTVGIGTSVRREFSIVNPTNKPYSFIWRCEDSGDCPFNCLTPNKSIEPGKEVKVSFEYQAFDLDLVESFWTFLIPEYNLSLPFLLVGTANEPVVYIDRAHLNLGSLLVGFEAHQTVFVVNGEDQPFHFTIQKTSCHSEGYQDSLVLEPMEGTVPPKNKIPLVIRFTPTREGDVVFNLVVTVQRKLQPLPLNVKGECYCINACVQFESPEGSIKELSPNHIHLVDFKEVELSDKSTCTFLVSNPGKVSLDVEYDLSGPAAMQPQLQVEPKLDTVAVGGQSHCTVTFCPQQKCVLKDLTFSIKIKNGPTFCCALMGSALALDVEFSFLKHNFGIHFIYCVGMVPATNTLVISNKSKRGISLDCMFSNTLYLEVSFTPQVLPPGGSMEVLFSFYPRKAVRYHEKVVFEIDKCSKHVVEILGQGIEMKINLEDPAHKVVNFGALQIGQQSRKLIPLVNNSHTSLTFCLLRTPSDYTLQDSTVLLVHPEGEVTLKSTGGRCVLELLFSPKQRMSPFREELQLQCLGAVRPLLVMKGCCQGVEVSLDMDYLQFGAVVQRCQATRRIIMQNTGDIGARFKWDVRSFAPDFIISPAEGYITAGMEVPLDVTFSPMELSQDLRYDDLCCTVEGGNPLKLTLTGSCIVPPVATEVVNFVCHVRSQCTQSLTLSNRVNQPWTLKCVIEGKHWIGPPTLILEPQQQNTYEITYKPLVMTADGERHEGSVFFSFPDGNGILYILYGIAEPPKAESTITEEIKCKTHHTQIVPVHNWLHRLQRFRAVLELIKLDRSDATVSLKGMEYIDVPALEKRNYKLSFFAYKEGQYNAKVTFKNEATGEYLFYNLNFKATAPGVIRTIEMVTRVRQTTSGSVEVENPLLVDSSFSVECQNADISVPLQFFVPAQSKGTLTFEYQPLCKRESSARLVLYAFELGHFIYDLHLKALPALPEKPLYFRAPLGSRHNLIAKFTNYSRTKTDYICKTDSPNFIVEKTIKAPAGNQAGTDISVMVHFEPCQLGEIRSLLTISSESVGEYVFPLYGTCIPPKAQGPLAISSGSSVSIPFKNVFQQTTTFSFHVDNPAFTVKGVETVLPQKTQNIQVTFEGPPTGSKGPCHGKLTIFCPRMEGHGQGIFWVYYLKGYDRDLSPETKTS
ncbi:hydrocephalus-inducing protein homolog [Myxocyprinus asiaticus]|uniref:hydrocephalus-inducing protein homolog n=1 Tax=Myxocyprinus asiaticus TaxID=70543 RepID=UPI0022233A2A|nr:hydrocephalus-inducing protein homolog [Myxocyprinus asiaticus]